MLKAVLTVLAVILLVIGLWLFAGASGWLGSDEERGEIRAVSRPAATTLQRSAEQTEFFEIQFHRGGDVRVVCPD